jgi:plasmid replication initiation protein
MIEEEIKAISRKDVVQSNDLSQTHLPISVTANNLFAYIISTLIEDKFYYVFDIRETLEKLGIAENNYSILLNALQQLKRHTIIINYNDHNNKQRGKEINILDEIDYPREDETKKAIQDINGHFTIKLGAKIAPQLFNLKNNFTVYQLKSFLSLKKNNAKRLYVFLASKKHLKTVRMTNDEIQYLFGKHYKEIRVLVHKEIRPAMEEIKAKTNIENIELVPNKYGRKIIGYTFHFDWIDKQYQLALTNTTNPKELQIHDTLVTEFGLTNSQAEKIRMYVPLAQITKTLYQIRVLNSNKRIQSLTPYVLSVFRKNYELDEIL